MENWRSVLGTKSIISNILVKYLLKIKVLETFTNQTSIEVIKFFVLKYPWKLHQSNCLRKNSRTFMWLIKIHLKLKCFSLRYKRKHNLPKKKKEKSFNALHHRGSGRAIERNELRLQYASGNFQSRRKNLSKLINARYNEE